MNLDEAPAALAESLRGDLLGEWLPLALADVVVLGCAACGVKTSRRATLESWGFRVHAPDAESERDRALRQLFDVPSGSFQ